ncbi:MAG: NADPH-dependent F420 reductase [Candidatus Krumholzibacteria bacterium]|nr:NADPH-dependent F420 reductase [Candidatus Krumholzibacteria bacterium]
MKIAVIGTGNVGGILGARWSEVGHEVTFGTRDPASPKVKSLLKLTENKARAASVLDAVSSSEVMVLATPLKAARDAIAVAGDLIGKILVDCTNPIGEGPDGKTMGAGKSAGEQVAEWARGARVVKAFNTTGSNNMADPAYGDHKATMFICGDDTAAKAVVSKLAAELGFEVCDGGRLSTARLLESLAMLWIHLAYSQGLGREIAIALLKR